MNKFIMGIDVGTESVRAAVVAPDGRFVGSASMPIETTRPHPGWAEQSPAQWRHGLVTAVSMAVKEAQAQGVSPEQIVALAADGTTCSVVLTGPDQTPTRDAILWMDVRAHEEALVFDQTRDPSLSYTGGAPVSAEWLPPKLLWLQRHEPAALGEAAVVQELTTWLAMEMTGRVVSDYCTSSMRWFYDNRSGRLPVSLYTSGGLEAELSKLPQQFAAPGSLIGELLPGIAAEMGLRPGTSVVCGAADCAAALLGMGVTRSGQLGISTGSSHVHMALAEQGGQAPGVFGGYADAVIPGLQMFEGGQVSTGSILRWFVSTLAGSPSQSISLEDLDRAATGISPGSDGLVFLDHFQGNRTPWSDSTSRGVIRGLTLSHTQAHIYRAILEGIAYGSATVLSRMEAAGIGCDELAMCGGSTQSTLWTQIHADVIGRAVVVPRQQQSAVLGSAILASVGAGMYKDIPDASDAMVQAGTRYEPNMERHRHYRDYVQQYQKTYQALAGLSRDMVRNLKTQ